MVVVMAATVVAPRILVDKESPYKVSEFPVRVASGTESYPAICGKARPMPSTRRSRSFGRTAELR